MEQSKHTHTNARIPASKCEPARELRSESSFIYILAHRIKYGSMLSCVHVHLSACVFYRLRCLLISRSHATFTVTSSLWWDVYCLRGLSYHTILSFFHCLARSLSRCGGVTKQFRIRDMQFVKLTLCLSPILPEKKRATSRQYICSHTIHTSEYFQLTKCHNVSVVCRLEWRNGKKTRCVWWRTWEEWQQSHSISISLSLLHNWWFHLACRTSFT